MATELVKSRALPVPVLKYPHWRVNFRPNRYEPELIPSLSECSRIVEQCKVRLRGWDFPCLSHDDREFGPNFLASWTAFADEIEYWRFYQSGQFLHLHAIEEAVSKELRRHLESVTRSRLRHVRIDWRKVPGYLSRLNFFHRVIEISEFAARLCAKDLYRDHLTISIELRKIKNFILTADLERGSPSLYQCTEDVLGKQWTFATSQVVAAGRDVAIQIAGWFFERFGLLSPSTELLRREQEDFREGRT